MTCVVETWRLNQSFNVWNLKAYSYSYSDRWCELHLQWVTQLDLELHLQLQLRIGE